MKIHRQISLEYSLSPGYNNDGGDRLFRFVDGYVTYYITEVRRQ